MGIDLNKYVFTTKIQILDGEHIELREPTIAELDGLNKADDNNRVSEIVKIFPSCIIGHSFEKEGGGMASNEEVFSMLKNSGSLLMEIISKWFESVPFQSRLQRKGK